jgi:hypothetical protein
MPVRLRGVGLHAGCGDDCGTDDTEHDGQSHAVIDHQLSIYSSGASKLSHMYSG